MNLNKFTKAELISKFKTLDSKVKNKQTNQSAQSSQTLTALIVTTLVNFKAIILKITLLAFLIKSFKKYSLFIKL